MEYRVRKKEGKELRKWKRKEGNGGTYKKKKKEYKELYEKKNNER